MNTAHNSACPNCFGDLSAVPCPHCGWQPGADNPPPALALGTLLDGCHRIGRVLGHGGFGITYLAWDENLRLRLAIKEYLPRDCATRAPDGVSLAIYSGQSGEQFAYGLDRFLEEAQALARFDQHPGIVTVKSFFRAHGTGYCVMDYVEGLTLRQFLERQPGGRIPVEHAWRLLQPVMDALRAVHREGLLHRDLAPDNIYITQDGRVKLLDFGAARFAAGEHSRSLSIILKPGYAPEEQYRSRGKQGPWTDVYGLAATFYRAVTGEAPPEALDRLDKDELVPPSRLGIAITAGQEAVLLKALAVKAAARYPSMHGLQEGWGAVAGAKAKPPVGAPAPLSPPLISGRYRPLGPDGAVIEDLATGLHWMRCSQGQQWNGVTCDGIAAKLTWEEAMRQARELSFAGQTDWRVPTKDELLTLVYCSSGQSGIRADTVEPCQGRYEHPKIDQVAFPKTPDAWFWSSSFDGGFSSSAWRVNFYHGNLYSYYKSDAYHVRLVRDGLAGAQAKPSAGVPPQPAALEPPPATATPASAIERSLPESSSGRRVGGALFWSLGVSFLIGVIGVPAFVALTSFLGTIEPNPPEPLRIQDSTEHYQDSEAIDAATVGQAIPSLAPTENREPTNTVQAPSPTDCPSELAELESRFTASLHRFALTSDPSGEHAKGLLQHVLALLQSDDKCIWNGVAMTKDGIESDGLRQISKKYIELSDGAVSRSDLDNARKWISLGLELDPTSDTLRDRAIDVLKPIAERGDAQAQVFLGRMYGGRGDAQDNVQAASWYRKAAAQGDSEAQYRLGVMYLEGRGEAYDGREAVRWFRMAAVQGYPQAQYNLGVFYEEGRGVPQDFVQAVSWYQKAADQGYARAQYNLGVMYENGRGAPQNFAQALSWYQKAADQSHPRAQSNLGVMYETGRGVPQDFAQAVSWYRKAAEQGRAVAQSNLGVMYMDGRGVAQDDREAVSLFRKAAEQEDSNAQSNLGVMYEKGRGVPQDFALAVSWYRKAAEQGRAVAQSNLGVMYMDGRGVVQDDREAVSLFSKAAEQEDSNAQSNLGMMYETGRGVPQDFAQAVSWYRKAAEQGQAVAQNNLGVMYMDGRGVAQDDREAVSLFRKAAEQEESNAQSNLGMMYQEGRGVAQDDREALVWYRRAAEQGASDAQTLLGAMYAEGRGVAQDDREALSWFRRAAEQGAVDAQTVLGAMYAEGRGVEQDDREALSWFRRAAEQGAADAQTVLGVMYERGRGVEQDDQQAVSWFRRAAEQGDSDGQTMLCGMFAGGRGVSQDFGQAEIWCRKAAEQGSSDAQYTLGLMYQAGLGAAEDSSQAAIWFEKAAAQGHSEAQRVLSR